jgi:Ca2+-binding RTX toxin-like protein
MAKIRGNDRDNTLTGTAGRDEIRGEDGNDILRGLGDNDRLRGDKGNDTLEGGAGNDRLRGEAGNDVLTGGEGRDRFEFSDRGGNDVVTDFNQDDDVLFLSVVGIDGMEDLSILNNAAGDAVISYFANGQTTSVTLLGIDSADLSSSDFIFRPH